ncbi:hypothetical protein EG343_09615 [Chryseobacterium nakagawai]|uniref:Transmembrane protein n=1 Tax=Chryseobacterium nakagawai TaxID=1241982 RepID=A0AAD0YLZ5_CHRNA|nr:hypothetical protein EG343_09615 [Chryseobacterium nakagawai]
MQAVSKKTDKKPANTIFFITQILISLSLNGSNFSFIFNYEAKIQLKNVKVDIERIKLILYPIKFYSHKADFRNISMMFVNKMTVFQNLKINVLNEIHHSFLLNGESLLEEICKI